MKIAVYAVCYNESFMLPFFYKHYKRYTDKIIIYDNESTDGSPDLAKSFGFEVRKFRTDNTLRDDVNQHIKNNCWKELVGKDYDWVFVLDMDELIYHKDLIQHLTTCKESGATILVPQGFQMIGAGLPTHGLPITEQIITGISDSQYSKPLIFNPEQIKELNTSPGAHIARPSGNVVCDASSGLKLLHYHWLSLKWVLDKNTWRSKRRSRLNRLNGWGIQYEDSPEKTIQIYKKYEKHKFNVIDYIEKPEIAEAWIVKRKSSVRT